MRYFDRSRCRTIFRDLEGGGTAFPSKCANDNVSANDDKEVVSWWMSVTFNSIRIRACRFHFFSFFFDNISRKMEVSSLISRARTNGKFLFKNNLAGRSWKFHVLSSLSLFFSLSRRDNSNDFYLKLSYYYIVTRRNSIWMKQRNNGSKLLQVVIQFDEGITIAFNFWTIYNNL